MLSLFMILMAVPALAGCGGSQENTFTATCRAVQRQRHSSRRMLPGLHHW